MKLFVAKGTCALASHIALEEAGADYQAVAVDLAHGEQNAPAYRQINPKGRVPALMTDRGVLTETPAILSYIAQSHPEAALAPRDDAYAFAAMQSFMNYLCSTVHVAHAHGRRGARWADTPEAIEEMKRKTPEVMAACFTLIEEQMFEGPWVMGESYTVADPYLYIIATWLESDGVDPKQFPKVYEHRNRMLTRPAVERALGFYAR